MKYTKEVLAPIVASSLSFSEVIRKLEKRWSGGLQSHLVRRIKLFELDSSHFLGQGRNRGLTHTGGPKKKNWSEILILRTSGRREKTFRLRRALIESGVDEKCNSCRSDPYWNNKDLVLQLNHINGNNIDDSKENLEFLCPNCHSQTETFGSKNKAR